MSPACVACGVFETMCQDHETADRVARKRLRTFRASNDQPYLVLPGNDEASQPDADDAEPPA